MSDYLFDLRNAPWLQRDDLKNLVAALDPDGGTCRYVGGAVRDTLCDQPVNDIDMATIHTPDIVMERLKAHNIKVIPTGIDHGTVTAVLPQGHVEITTLRRDVSTDGRRATIAYSTEWREDAARRDFTINALYLDPLTHELYDYFNGQADLKAGNLRFIGDADARIREDYLRILRFFRFQARFGTGNPDSQALDACKRQAAGLKSLSRERIASELLALLALDDPLATVELMFRAQIWPVILPETGSQYMDMISRLLAREKQFDMDVSALSRLASMLPADIKIAQEVAARLRFSNAMHKELALLSKPEPCDAAHARQLAYRLGHALAMRKILLCSAEEDVGPALDAIRGWIPPAFEISGKDVIAAGLIAGPKVSHALTKIERQWMAEGFPARQRQKYICNEITKIYMD